MAKQITTTIGDKDYTLQKPGVKWYSDNVDRCTGKNGMQTGKYFQSMLDNVVIEPKGLKLDDFDDNMEDLEELIQRIEAFFRNKPI